MTPGARLQAAIELIEQIAGTQTPADRLVGNYFRSRRYAGSKDRRAVTDMVYDVLRRRGEYAWRAGGTDSRRLLLAHLTAPDNADNADNANMDDVAGLFDGTQYGPANLDGEEQATLSRLTQAENDKAPAWVGNNYPEWLDQSLTRRFGSNLDGEMAAMMGRASVDLRINALKSNAGEVADEVRIGATES